jgi:geranylgeranylglycerol-phosphate geranylgeranyltransferase
MKYYFLLIFLFINPIQSFLGKQHFNIRKNGITRINTFEYYDSFPRHIGQLIDVKEKTKSFIKLIRPENIMPTLLLGFTGGFISNPSIKGLLNSKPFIVTNIITFLILCSSMITNDIFDYKIDKINSPERPLVNGEITIKEAVISNVFLLGGAELLSLFYLPMRLQHYTHIAAILSIIYTPILKHILFIKNLSCASLISSSLFFSGIAANNGPIYFTDNKSLLLLIASQLIFLGSLYIEILLDIGDEKGDRENNIITIPVLFGKDFAWNMANRICIINILWNTFLMVSMFGYSKGNLLLFICSPLIMNLRNIKRRNYDKDIIKSEVRNISLPLFFSLFYLCLVKI